MCEACTASLPAELPDLSKLPGIFSSALPALFVFVVVVVFVFFVLLLVAVFVYLTARMVGGPIRIFLF